MWAGCVYHESRFTCWVFRLFFRALLAGLFYVLPMYFCFMYFYVFLHVVLLSLLILCTFCTSSLARVEIKKSEVLGYSFWVSQW